VCTRARVYIYNGINGIRRCRSRWRDLIRFPVRRCDSPRVERRHRTNDDSDNALYNNIRAAIVSGKRPITRRAERIKRAASSFSRLHRNHTSRRGGYNAFIGRTCFSKRLQISVYSTTFLPTGTGSANVTGCVCVCVYTVERLDPIDADLQSDGTTSPTVLFRSIPRTKYHL